MSSSTAFQTVEQYLRAQWTATPLVFENEDLVPPGQPDHFVHVEMFGDFFDQASIGAEPRASNLWRETGQLFLHVMTVRGIGSLQARTYAKQLVDLFRGEDIGSVTFREASIGAGEPGRTDGNYFAMTATIEWQRDE